MSLNIVFGSIKEPKSRIAEQEFDFPSVKIEKSRGAGTSRRILFNRPACELLDLTDGATQAMLFGFAQPGVGESPRLFIINTEDFSSVVEQKTYNTSKNKASYADSKEKGKAIASRPLTAEVINFLQLDQSEDVDVNLYISVYTNEGEATVYELSLTPVAPVEAASEVADNVENTQELPESNEVDFDTQGEAGSEANAEWDSAEVGQPEFHVGN